MNQSTNTLSETKINHRRLNYPTKYRKLYERVSSGIASPRTAIKAMCIECMGGIVSEIADCTDCACPLYQYRPKKNAQDRP